MSYLKAFQNGAKKAPVVVKEPVKKLTPPKLARQNAFYLDALDDLDIIELKIRERWENEPDEDPSEQDQEDFNVEFGQYDDIKYLRAKGGAKAVRTYWGC